MNRIVEKIRAMLRRGDAIPRHCVSDLCDEADALQDVVDKIAERDADKAMRRAKD
jgi:hypothetical protein